MRFVAYLTKNCIDTSKKYGLLQEVNNLKEKIESDQSVQSWDSFLPKPYIKKAIGNHYRLFAIKQLVDDNKIMVISFIACVNRGYRDYLEILTDLDKAFGKFIPTKDDLLQYLSSYRKNIEIEILPLNDKESYFLYESSPLRKDNDLMFYESTDWVRCMNNPKYKEEITRFYDILLNQFDRIKSKSTNVLKDDKGNSILFRYFEDINAIYLVAPSLSLDDKRNIEKQSYYYDILNNENISYRELLKKSRKTYPYYVLADESLWKSIQKDDTGNIALSPEESEILSSIANRDSDKIFPLFIYGRAGSGKSTVLQYLFVNYLLLYFSKDENNRLDSPPLYLAYSEDLIELAKQNIKSILKCNIAYSDNAKLDLSDKNVINTFDKSFAVFHKFLLNLLPKEKRNSFSEANKMTFPRFKNWFEKSKVTNPDRYIRNLSSELVWHTIRTYIKGMRFDKESEFTYESYCELPEKQRSVELETFEIIYEKIWKNLYLPYCEQNSYWDEQDLVFEIINSESLDLSKYPVVFCDEAQDFSKLELDLILRLSLFYNRTVPPSDLKYIPFAFAGDPFQTLNPTGFDWDAVKANFHEKIVLGLDRTYKAKIDINDKELCYNYRSTSDIVGLCNLIQILRGILFEQNNLLPQKTWFDQHSKMPVYFNVKEPSCEKNLKEQEELVVILPCQEGEEENFVKEDEFLNKIVKNETRMRNFLSPMRAKGLEFSRVILYKFGSICAEEYPDLFTPLTKGSSFAADRDSSLPKRYLLNRLYVAASRAKNQLIIVDDDRGLDFLWNNKSLKDFDSLIKNYQGSKRANWTPNDLKYVIKGSENDWVGQRDNPYDLAQAFEYAGISERDPYKLQLAESNYYRADSPQEAKKCKAKRLEIIGNYEDAGDLYLELALYEEALDCYWLANKYEKIKDLNALKNTIKFKAAEFVVSNKTEQDINNFLSELIRALDNDRNKKICDDPKWVIFMDDLISKILKDQSSYDLKKIYGMLRELEVLGISASLKEKYAEIAYHSKDYEKAVVLWELSGKKDEKNKKYQESKAYTESYPSNLIWLERLGKYEDIIESWRKNKLKSIEKDFVKIIAYAMVKEEKYEELIEILSQYPYEYLMFEIYQQIKNIQKTELIDRIGLLYLRTLIENLNWYEAVRFIDEETHNEILKNKLQLYLIYNVAKSRDYRDIAESVSTVFFEEEFTNKYSIDKLCDKLRQDRIISEENSLKTLNNLLEQDDLFKKITSTKNISPSARLRRRHEIYLKERTDFSLKMLNRFLLEEFYPEESPRSRSILSIFIKDNIINNWDNLKIPLKIAGPAVEKANTFIECIEFYEKYWKNDGKTNDSTFAFERWIACKLKYADYLSKTKKIDELAKKHRIEVKEAIERRKMNINIESINLEPEVSYNEEELDNLMNEIEISDLSSETIDGILSLHKLEWKPEKIANSYKIDIDKIRKVIKCRG